MEKVVIDCDPGHDDAIAILYAARKLDVLGITTVFGNSTVDHTTRNALRICDLAGLTAPVASGAGAPLIGAFFVSPVHGETGLDGARHLPPPRRAAAATHAVDFLIDMARHHRGELNIVALGPLTNLALAFRKEPRLAGWLRRVSVMGGSTGTGNVMPFAEANFYKDPEAAEIVFASGAELYMAGLNFTGQARLTPERAAGLRRIGGPVAEAVAGILDFYLARHQARYGREDAPMHDPSAMLILTRPDLVEYRLLPVRIELASPQLRGMSACDMRSVQPYPGEILPAANVHVGMGMDGAAAVEEIFATIGHYNDQAQRW